MTERIQTWFEIMKEFKPSITETEADNILWNETSFPFSDVERVVLEIKNFFKNITNNE